MPLDVDNLLRRTPLSAETYQTFRSPKNLDFRPAAVGDESADVVMERTPGRVTPISMPLSDTPPPTGGPRYGTLRSVLVKDGGARVHGMHSSSRAYCAVRVSGAAGGCGVSTILATLARGFSAKGQRAVLLDTETQGSVLPFYFSKASKVSMRGVQIASGNTGQPVIFLEPHADSPEGWVESSLAAFSAHPYRLLLDGTATSRTATIHLIVLNPDLQSMRRVETIYKSLSAQPALFVLNKYDGAVALHKQVLDLLSPKIGMGKLFTVRRSDEFSEALAEGCTIFDFAAHSPACDDVLHVLAAIEQLENGIAAKSAAAKGVTA